MCAIMTNVFQCFVGGKKNELGQNGSLFVMKYNKRELISILWIASEYMVYNYSFS